MSQADEVNTVRRLIFCGIPAVALTASLPTIAGTPDPVFGRMRAYMAAWDAYGVVTDEWYALIEDIDRQTAELDSDAAKPLVDAFYASPPVLEIKQREAAALDLWEAEVWLLADTTPTTTAGLRALAAFCVEREHATDYLFRCSRSVRAIHDEPFGVAIMKSIARFVPVEKI